TWSYCEVKTPLFTAKMAQANLLYSIPSAISSKRPSPSFWKETNRKPRGRSGSYDLRTISTDRNLASRRYNCISSMVHSFGTWQRTVPENQARGMPLFRRQIKLKDF